MGWWDKSNEPDNAVGNNSIVSQTTSTGWWDKIKGWGSALWNSNLTAQVTNNVSSFTYNTILKSVELAPATVKTAASVLTHAPTRRIAYNVARILVEDIAPYVAINYVFDSLKKYTQDELIEKDAPWVSTSTFLQTSLALLQVALWAYNTRRKTQATVRMTVVAIEAAKSLSTVNNDLPKQVCIDENCDLFRYVRGNFRDLTTFWATEVALSLVGYLPLGDKIVPVLSVFHRGRYALTMVLPDLCQRHQVEYLKEYAELPITLGIHEFISTTLLSWGIESLTGIPRHYYKPFVAQAMLLTQISVVAHSRLPPPVIQSQRKIIDPVGAYQSFIGFIFDIVSSGLKKQLPLLLQGPPTNIPWQTIYNLAKEVQKNPYTQKIETIILPRMLHSSEAFISDPVIQPYWLYLRERSILALKAIENSKESFLKISKVATVDPGKAAKLMLIKVAVYDPQKAAKLLWLIFGIPKSIGREVLTLLGKKEFMLDLGSIRRKLESLEVKKSLKEVDLSPLAIQLRQADSTKALMPPPPPASEDKEEGKKVDAKAIINPRKNTGTNPAKNIIITSNRPALHKQPTNLIQTKFTPPIVSKLSTNNLRMFNSSESDQQDKSELDSIDGMSLFL
ncbi:Uncharacterised protein [Legionella busanensis]|uniref:Uncharacterized protein n=1 Tax=Legionella busanensis TaxID=190655 RepID=A0A378JT00_9GAMM|nr:hypothetical protein [Legionella busanensis]STX52900.1 Uncharacterised protein [Legionella busanensis]